jgi:hypothetical protein
MAKADEPLHDEAADERAVGWEAPPWAAPLAWMMRAVVRIWVIAMVVAAAAFGGISVYQYYQTRAELSRAREEPDAQSYAVVAYRAELARQIEAYRNNWRDFETVPEPPQRPRLLQEIDQARARNTQLRQEAEARFTARPQAQFTAPP